MNAPSRRWRLSATTMLKKGRALAPPRESRMTTMIYPRVVGRRRKSPPEISIPASRHALWPPGQRHAGKPVIITFPPHMSLIRPSQDADLPEITAIYAHHVLHGTGTFETTPPTESDMATRRADVLGKGLPHLLI